MRPARNRNASMPESQGALSVGPSVALNRGDGLPEGAPLEGVHLAPLLKALFRATDYGVLMTDLGGTDILCNPRFGVLFGVDPEDIVRLPREQVRKIALSRVADPLAFTELVERAYADPWLEFEDEIMLKAPRHSILRRHTGPVLDEEGAVLGRIWTFLDVTETRQLQAEVASYTSLLEEKLQQQALALQSAQKQLLETVQMRAVGTLAMGIAHDLRNILTTLRLEIAIMDPAYRPLATTQMDRLYALTHCLLALSEEAPQPFSPVDLNEIIDFVFKLIYGQAEIDGIQLEKHIRRGVPPVYGNPRRLEHLFVNLLTNALNAVAAHGGQIRVLACKDHGRVRVDVRDTGPGIPPQNLPHLFEPFFTTHPNRTGLGLFSARRIVEAHGGEIKITSHEGQGTCVSVWLPI